MFSKFSSTEIEFKKKFAKAYEDHEVIRFYDHKLPDMYNHNFTLIKNEVDKVQFRRIILAELEKRKEEKATFLRIEINVPIGDDFIENLPVTPEVSKYEFLYIEPKMKDSLNGNDRAIVKKAQSEEVLKDGMEVDILANQEGMGVEFATKRIDRKAEVYRRMDSNLDLYVCYDQDKAIGNCEFMLNKEIVKIEDFDIIEAYQRKGFGTAVLKYFLGEALKHGAEYVYLIADGEDTAKEMYRKCGFKKIGEKTELFFADLHKYQGN